MTFNRFLRAYEPNGVRFSLVELIFGLVPWKSIFNVFFLCFGGVQRNNLFFGVC